VEIETWTAALGAIAAGAVIFLARYVWERVVKKEEPAAAIAPPAPPYLAVLVEIRDAVRRVADAIEDVNEHQMMVDIAKGHQAAAADPRPVKRPPARKRGL
jgi:hypothetical protein